MTEEKWPYKTRRVECPAPIFGPDKYLIRKRHIKTRSIRKLEDSIKVNQDFDECYGILARYTLEWNIDDCETGEPLPQPHNNPDVFDDLDTGEQFAWLMNEVYLSPNFPTPK